MNKVKEIKLTPEILGPVTREGCEEIYQIAKAAIIIYEDGTTVKGDRVSTTYYREVDESRANEEGIKKFTSCRPEDFVMVTKYLEPIKMKEPLSEFFEKYPELERKHQ